MHYIWQKPLDYSKPVGLVFGSFSPLHQGHLDLIYRAKKECPGGVLAVVTGYDDDRGGKRLPLHDRYNMTLQFFRDDDLTAVYAMDDGELGIVEYTEKQDQWQWDTWLDGVARDIISANAGVAAVDREWVKRHIKFYVGEPAYKRDLTARGLDVALADRTGHAICGTDIRRDPIGHWDDMAWTYHRIFSHNVLVTGTASEGKTTLVEDIARYFNLPYSYEWARGYIDRHMIGDWQFDARDFLTFLSGQYNYNRERLESRLNPGVFISDTDALVTKMYAEYYANDPEMRLTPEDYNGIIAPAADLYASKSRWDKIFVVVPHGEFVDDHTRWMAHGTFEARNELAGILFRELEKAGLRDKCEILDGGYAANFERVKGYVGAVLEGEKMP